MKQEVCTVCEGGIDEGGITGFFGIIPVAFCQTCLVGVRDLAESMCLRCQENYDDD